MRIAISPPCLAGTLAGSEMGAGSSPSNDLPAPRMSTNSETLRMVNAQRSLNCVAYRTRNIGDMIQTLALTRLLPPLAAVFRHDLGSAPAEGVFVVNGFLERDRPPRRGADCLFAGVSGPYMRHALYLDWLRRSPWPVGARDPATLARLSKAGVSTEFVGCATLTLPRYDGPRQGVVSVDFEGPGTRLTHVISRHMTVAAQWTAATELLAKYRTSEAVYTSRLHVALPCLAFGTPVWIARPGAWGFPERFSLLEEMGVPFAEFVVRDVAPQRERYIRFFGKHLGQTIEPGETKMPALVGPDRLRPREQCRFISEDLWHWLQVNWGREGRRLRRLRRRANDASAMEGVRVR